MEQKVLFDTPARLAARLRRDELDAALVSVTEVLLSDRYEVLDGVAIASRGEVRSVFLAHRGRLEDVPEVFCDPASLTSVNLLRVLLAERGIRPGFRALPSYSAAAQLDAVLLIGDRALEFSRAPHPHQIYDLGAAWHRMTGLPAVFAVWALRRGAATPADCRALRSARDHGVACLEDIALRRTEFDLEFRREYFRRNIYYSLGPEEKRALCLFADLMQKHGSGPTFEPRYTS